jgi:hypothetical protein
MPQPLSSFRGGELPELRGFVDLKLDKSKAPPSFYEIFAFLFHPKDLDVPVENLSVVIAKQLLEAKFCETAEMSSVFIVHNGEAGRRAHFDSIMSCREKPLRLPPAQRANPTVMVIQQWSKQRFHPHHPGGVSDTPPWIFFFSNLLGKC